MYCKDTVPHVLVIPSWYPSSTCRIRGSFFREQAIALSRHGCRVGVIYPQLPLLKRWRESLKPPYRLTEEIDDRVATLRWHALFPTLTGAKYVRLGLRLYEEYVQRFGSPDIIHAHSIFYGGTLAYKIKQNFSIPFLVTEHSTAFARGLIGSAQRQTGVKVLSDASRRIAVSEPFCELLADFFPPEAGGWMPLPNIVSRRFIHAPLTANKRSNRQFIFLSVAQLIKSKAIDNLIVSFAGAFSGNPAVTLRIVGDGPERKTLMILAEQLGVRKQIQFLGQLSREQVVVHMANASAFVLASRHETFGVVIIEALAMGNPVVATRSGGPESIVRPQDGELVPPDHVPALMKALQHMYQNIEQYDPQAIRQACLDRFSEEIIASKLKQLYQVVIQEQGC